MEPYDSPHEAEFRAAARDFLAEHAEPIPSDRVAPSAIIAEWTPEEEAERLAEAQAWQKTKHAGGWAGISWPTEYGGRGGTLMEQLIFHEEESDFDVPHDALAVGLGWCGPAVIAHGSEEQRQRLIPPLLSGDEVWSQLYSEPNAGSDLAGLSTKAYRDGDEWVINGQKVWTTFAHRSDWGLCIARHDSGQPKHRGLTAFIVDMHSAGIECRPLKQMTGSSNFNEVFLNDVRVPDANRIGAVGEGWPVVITTFIWERFNLIATGERILAALARLMQERGLSNDPRIRDRYMRLYVAAAAARYNSLKVLTAVSRGSMPGPEGSIFKLAATSIGSELYEFAVDLMGADGMLDTTAAPWDGEWHGGFLGMPGLRIGGGTDEVQRNIIGERVLGLPPEPRVDKGIPFADIPS